MIKEIYKYQFPVFKIEAIITVFTIFVALVLANAIWETTVQFLLFRSLPDEKLLGHTYQLREWMEHNKTQGLNHAGCKQRTEKIQVFA